ncbi:potassium channel LctB [Marinococcus luteus]|uniref:Potassium channel LctB n=1 Tax=Marinococcus luteus TaxID=1122204 RepID=A0A1H2WIE4_9BACI|nr:ion channel [Marinococcus luteus]SDW80443.1 potassium channel LctB [Marinococcus luteus]
MLPGLLLGLTFIFVLINLYYFFTNKTYKHTVFSPAMFYKLFVVMLSLTFAFALLYYFLSFYETVFRINDPTDTAAESTFLNCLYFSGVTILSVGYGDLVPVGTARAFALLQAALGLLLPTAYFMKALGSSQNKESS